MSDARDSQLFQALLLQLHHAAWAALGKVPNPLSGKVEIDLESARLAIDTLGAIETRTQGRLDNDERQLLDRLLRDLRLNYLDEQKKASAPSMKEARPEDAFEKADAGGAAADEHGRPPAEGTPTV